MSSAIPSASKGSPGLQHKNSRDEQSTQQEREPLFHSPNSLAIDSTRSLEINKIFTGAVLRTFNDFVAAVVFFAVPLGVPTSKLTPFFGMLATTRNVDFFALTLPALLDKYHAASTNSDKASACAQMLLAAASLVPLNFAVFLYDLVPPIPVKTYQLFLGVLGTATAKAAWYSLDSFKKGNYLSSASDLCTVLAEITAIASIAEKGGILEENSKLYQTYTSFASGGFAVLAVGLRWSHYVLNVKNSDKTHVPSTPETV